ncbi:hypothetical protein [Tunicatimonas pelagia]|uniref:hypothetical protein n=1 Tax=Tunicatimonas pelagia TaxID=931531 RepID=UPI0026652A5D|nr:hypothetical protein [Tunicatimonas pelagia]WKN40681.1 hypothetical protein P0M28_16705 [Tunicatimonas pelagia]
MRKVISRLRDLYLRERFYDDNIVSELDLIQDELNEIQQADSSIQPAINKLENFKRVNMMISVFPTVIAMGLVVFVFILNQRASQKILSLEKNEEVRTSIISKMKLINDSLANDSLLMGSLSMDSIYQWLRYRDLPYEISDAWLRYMYIREEAKLINSEIDSLEKLLVRDDE